MVLCQHLGQAVIGEVHRDARPQGAAGFALDRGQLAAHLLHFPGSGGAVEQHLLPCRCEADALPRAQHDLHPKLLLQCLDTLGQRRLGHIQLIRCMGDVAGLVQCVQQLVIFFVHVALPSCLNFSYHSCSRSVPAHFRPVPYLLFIIQQIFPNEKGDIRLDFPESPFRNGILLYRASLLFRNMPFGTSSLWKTACFCATISPDEHDLLPKGVSHAHRSAHPSARHHPRRL